MSKPPTVLNKSSIRNIVTLLDDLDSISATASDEAGDSKEVQLAQRDCIAFSGEVKKRLDGKRTLTESELISVYTEAKAAAKNSPVTNPEELADLSDGAKVMFKTMAEDQLRTSKRHRT